jgi:hypothetical protein
MLGLVRIRPAKLRFVNLYRALQFDRLGHQFANLFHHAPRGFVGHSRLALNLLRAHSDAGGSHQFDDEEPSRKLVVDLWKIVPASGKRWLPQTGQA